MQIGGGQLHPCAARKGGGQASRRGTWASLYHGCRPMAHPSNIISASTQNPCKPGEAAWNHHYRRFSRVAAAGTSVGLPATRGREHGPARIAVFVSGGGSNMKAVHAAIQRGEINGELVVRFVAAWKHHLADFAPAIVQCQAASATLHGVPSCRL